MTNFKKFVLYKGLAILGFLIPLLVLFCVEPSYFISRPSFSVGIGGVTAAIIVIIVLKNKLMDWISKNALLFSMLIFSVIVTFLRDSLELLPLIGWCAVVGIFISNLFDRVADVYHAAAFENVSDKVRVVRNKDVIPDKEAIKIAFGLAVDESFISILRDSAASDDKKR